MERSTIYRLLDEERDYQDIRWGDAHDKKHNVEAFMVYMDSYLRKAKDAITGNGGVPEGLEELRKVVALGIACFEVHGVPQRKLRL